LKTGPKNEILIFFSKKIFHYFNSSDFGKNSYQFFILSVENWPKEAKNGPKTDQKWSEWSKNGQKWSKNVPKMVPKLAENNILIFLPRFFLKFELFGFFFWN